MVRPRTNANSDGLERDRAATNGAAEIAERVRAARAKIGMTRKQLASASRASERYLANIEQGQGNPSVELLSSVAAALDIALAELLPQGGEQSAVRAEAAATIRRLPEQRLAMLMSSLKGSISTAKGRRIVLLGLRGAGKSSLGRALSERLACPFLEITQEVEHAYGGEIGLLIEVSGQNALRRYEREAWATIMEGQDAAVIAAPGGVVADPELYDQILASAHSIWLQASPEDHMERVMAQGDFRPMSDHRGGGAMRDLKAILKARSADYSRADRRLDTSAQSFADTVALLEQLAGEVIG